ncbi:unnamed protein product [Choristocarpus tenellus]
MSRFVWISLCAASLAAAQTITVENPGNIAAGDEFRTTWEPFGTGLRYNYYLYPNSECSGTAVTNLCSKSNGCLDNTGDENLVVPSSVVEGIYSFKVETTTESASGCSGGFAVSSDTSVPSPTPSPVVSPTSQPASSPTSTETGGITLQNPGPLDAGDGFKAEWTPFASNLRYNYYLYPGSTCSGSSVASLCSKSNGCLDNTGDENLFIPEDIAYGTYSLGIFVTEETGSGSGCSGGFAIASDISPTPTTPAPAGTATPAPVVTPAPGPVSQPTAPTSSPVDSPWDDEFRPAKVACDPSISVEYRYSSTSQRMYLEHTDGTTGGCATMTGIFNSRLETDGSSKGPVYVLDPSSGDVINDAGVTPTGHWLVEADLYVTHGITLQIYGTDVGGDCDALRILSTDSMFFNLRGHGGSLDFLNTLVTSWDTGTKDPRPLDDITEGRSFISCISEIDDDETCDGSAKSEMGECRMDIVDSEMAYLGYQASESYGLTWKVRGFCVDKSNPEVFDNVQVTGDILNSEIHHMFFGHYSYGHQGGVWSNNVVHDNEWYGFDPHDDSDYLTIHNNIVYNNGKHGIIASKRCDHVSIQNNEVYDGGETAAGIMLHRSGDQSIVKGNYLHDMQDAGIAFFESFEGDISNNLIENCKYGIRLSMGAANNNVYQNTFDSCYEYGLYSYMGTNEPEVENSTGRPYANMFYSNTISNSPGGIRFKNSDDMSVTGNTFLGTEVMNFDSAIATILRGNTIPDNVDYEYENGACFESPTQAPDADIC